MTGLVEALEPLLRDFPDSESTATVDEHADRVLGMVGGEAPEDPMAQARMLCGEQR